MSASNKQVVQQVFDAMAADRADLLHGLLAPEVKWWVPPSAAAQGMPRPLVGRDAVVGLIANPAEFFRPGTRRWLVHHLVGEDDLVAAHVNMEAETASGEAYSNEYHWLLRLQDGAVVEVWEHVDTSQFTALVFGGPGNAGA
jgi:ketosteroid isomerase-like protein